MSKIISVFEKLNLVEKVNDTTSTSNVLSKETDKENEVEKIEKESPEKDPKIFEQEDQNNHSEARTDFQYDKKMDVSEIYSLYDIENSDVNTIFMLGNFINALPENLPYEVKKSSIMGIINASNTDLNKLLTDGERRIGALKQFAKEYHRVNHDSIQQFQEEIKKLEDLICDYKEQIQFRETMMAEQNHIIKYEVEKIQKIIDFFSDDD